MMVDEDEGEGAGQKQIETRYRRLTEIDLSNYRELDCNTSPGPIVRYT